MSTVITDNLTGKTAAGNVTITSEGGSATMQLQQGVAKFWIMFNGTGTPAAYDSFNAASITDNGTGLYDHNLTNNMGSANYAKTYGGTGTSSDSHIKHYGSIEVSSTSSVLKTHSFHNSTGAHSDEPEYCATVHGDLA